MLAFVFGIVLMLGVTGDVVSYGDYRFYRNFGQALYDYSGNNYHGVNGDDLSTTTNDATTTDRGLYFSTSSYVQLHTDTWESPPGFTTNWKTLVWLLVATNGIILQRTETYGTTLLEVSSLSQVFQYAGYVCPTTCSSETVTGASFSLSTTYSDEWMALILTVSSASPFTVNEELVGGSPTDRVFSADTVGDGHFAQVHTILGASSGGFAGFIYSVIIGSSDLDVSSYYNSDNSGCTGQCYFGSDGSLCNCSVCSLVPSEYCLSTCATTADPSDCSALSGACAGMPQAGDSCAECDVSINLSCDTEGLDVLSSVCHSNCVGCTGAAATDCLECAYTYATSTCECPINSSPVDGVCVCSDTLVMGVSEGEYACISCNSPCVTCSGTTDYCTSCPALSTPSSGICQCENGYYDACDESCDLNCLECAEGCETCTNGSSCTTCVEGSLNASGECIVCESAEYLSVTHQCEACRSLCATCSSYSVCIDCVSHASLVSNLCHCNTDYEEVEGECLLSNFTVTLDVDSRNIVWIRFGEELLAEVRESDLDIEIEGDPSFDWSLKDIDPEKAKLQLDLKDNIEYGDLLTVNFHSQLQSVRGNYIAALSTSAELYHQKGIKETGVTKAVGSSLKYVVAGLYLVSTVTMDYSGLWSTVHTIQSVQYIALANTTTTPDLNALLIAHSDYLILPNFLEYILADEGSTPSILPLNFGFHTNDLLLNIGQYMTFIFFCALAAPLIWILIAAKCYVKYSLVRLISEQFRYSIYLRFAIESYVGVLVAVVLQLQDTMTVLFPVIFSLAATANADSVNNPTDEFFHSKWGSFFYELRQNGNIWRVQFYSIFLAKRFFYVFNVLLFSEVPKVQSVVNSSIQVLVFAIQYLYYILNSCFFKDKVLHILTIANETLVTVIYIFCMSMTLLESANEVLGGFCFWLLFFGTLANVLVPTGFRVASSWSRYRYGESAIVSPWTDSHNQTNEAQEIISNRPMDLKSSKSELRSISAYH